MIDATAEALIWMLSAVIVGWMMSLAGYPDWDFILGMGVGSMTACLIGRKRKVRNE